MTALLVIDMQVACFTAESPRHDAAGVVSRINALARAVREGGGTVVFIQHSGAKGDPFEPGTAGWQLVPELERAPGDVVVSKTTCDAFYDTELAARLSRNEDPSRGTWRCGQDHCWSPLVGPVEHTLR